MFKIFSKTFWGLIVVLLLLQVGKDFLPTRQIQEAPSTESELGRKYHRLLGELAQFPRQTQAERELVEAVQVELSSAAELISELESFERKKTRASAILARVARRLEEWQLLQQLEELDQAAEVESQQGSNSLEGEGQAPVTNHDDQFY